MTKILLISMAVLMSAGCAGATDVKDLTGALQNQQAESPHSSQNLGECSETVVTERQFEMCKFLVEQSKRFESQVEGSIKILRSVVDMKELKESEQDALNALVNEIKNYNDFDKLMSVVYSGSYSNDLTSDAVSSLVFDECVKKDKLEKPITTSDSEVSCDDE